MAFYHPVIMLQFHTCYNSHKAHKITVYIRHTLFSCDGGAGCTLRNSSIRPGCDTTHTDNHFRIPVFKPRSCKQSTLTLPSPVLTHSYFTVVWGTVELYPRQRWADFWTVAFGIRATNNKSKCQLHPQRDCLAVPTTFKITILLCNQISDMAVRTII